MADRRIFDVGFYLPNNNGTKAEYIEQAVTFKYDHWWPRLLGTGGFTCGYTVLLKRSPEDDDPTDPAYILFMHELGHVWQRVKLGFIGYWARMAWEFVRRPFDKHSRPLEQQADRIALDLSRRYFWLVQPGPDFYEYIKEEAGYGREA